MEPFKQNLLEEQKQLIVRIKNAHKFMLGAQFKELDPEDRWLLFQQVQTMKLYKAFLQKRIERAFTEEDWKDADLNITGTAEDDFTMGSDFWEKFIKHCDETGRTVNLTPNGVVKVPEKPTDQQEDKQ